MHAPGLEMRRITLLANEDHPSLPSDAMQPAAISQHEAYVALLQHEAVEVLLFDRLLDSALQQARRRGALEQWIGRAFPHVPELVDHVDELTADELLGRGRRLFYREDDAGRLSPLVSASKWLPFVRDVAAMTPRGLVLGRFAHYDRACDTVLMDLAFRFAPELSGYEIAFDADAEDVFLQGGDLAVLDGSTLLLGTGSLTEEHAAERLAQRLGLEVLGVSMAPLRARQSGYAGWTGTHAQFLHLDSCFTLLDSAKALAVPYVLEADYAEAHPVIELLEALERDLERRQSADSVRHKQRWPTIRASCQALAQLGWVTRYEAGTGRATPLGRKLVDVLRERGYEIIPVGGRRGRLPIARYLLERVLFELNLQAANVVALRPGVVAAYRGNRHTLRALREAGVEVLAFPGSGLAMWHGGPRCLTLPLERR